MPATTVMAYLIARMGDIEQAVLEILALSCTTAPTTGSLPAVIRPFTVATCWAESTPTQR